MDYKDYYKTLGVDKKATTADIKAAYRKLAHKHHPDVNAGDKRAEARFRGTRGATVRALSSPLPAAARAARRCESFALAIHGRKRSLDAIHFACLEVRLTALNANPGRHRIPGEVVPLPVNRKRHDRSFHPAAAVQTLHSITSA